MQVRGPHGTVGRLGAGIHSRLGRLLTGSPAIDVRGVAMTTWRARGPLVGLPAGGIALVVVGLARLRSRRG